MICDESVNLVEVCLHENEVEVLCMGSPLGKDGLSSREGRLPHLAAVWVL